MVFNKKGVDIISSGIILLIINLLVFGIFFGVVYRSKDNAAFYEQVYAKQIAISIDSAKEGSIFSINLGEISNILEKNNVDLEKFIIIEDGKVSVKITNQGNGYIYPYVSNYKIEKLISKNGEDVFLSINVMGADDEGE